MQINSSQHWELSNKKSLFLSVWKGFIYQETILLPWNSRGVGEDALCVHGMRHMRKRSGTGGFWLCGSQGTLHIQKKPNTV